MNDNTRVAGPAGYELKLEVVTEGFDGEFCWFHPHIGMVAGHEPGATPTAVLTMQKYWVQQDDAFFPIQSQYSTDLGANWSELIECTDTLGRHIHADGTIEGICDFTPKWHGAAGKLIGTGQSVLYHPGNVLIHDRRRHPVWSAYDAQSNAWASAQALELPDIDKFWMISAGSTQRIDLENGDILLPLNCRTQALPVFSTLVARCRFENGQLRYCEHGSELMVPIDRGLYEPSIAAFDGKFYLTMRNDQAAYWAVSEDGTHYSEPRKWTFDDGADLGSYNTQAHWVTHSNALFLCYTRRGADNDNVVRNRAPLFMAQIDPVRMVVLRDTETVLVPNLGAQLGNFGVTTVNRDQTWVTTSEGMDGSEPRRYGANGRVYLARIVWNQPNLTWGRS